jgi:IclR family acetate operon transcriptional repressor
MNVWQNIPTIRNISQKDNATYTNTSLVRATSILLCLSNGVNTNTEIAKYCKFSTSTVHRLLNVMKTMRWVIQDQINHKYYLGPIVNELAANQSSAHRFLLAHALQEMGRLSSLSEETINLSVLVQLHSVLLHGIHSKRELIITEMNSGYGMLFGVGATAKVLLSQLGEAELREILSKVDLAELSGHVIKDKYRLMAQLKGIKARGYGISSGERIAGAICISAAINNYSCPAALSVLGPESRLRPRMEEIRDELLTSVRRISNSLRNVVVQIV